MVSFTCDFSPRYHPNSKPPYQRRNKPGTQNDYLVHHHRNLKKETETLPLVLVYFPTLEKKNLEIIPPEKEEHCHKKSKLLVAGWWGRGWSIKETWRKGRREWKGQKYLPCSQSRRGPGYQDLYSQTSLLGVWLRKGPVVMHFVKEEG